MDNYKISVLMCTYNETCTVLSKAIDSIINQTFSDFEFIIIIDNPKRNDLISMVEEYSMKDNRIRFSVNEKNMGLPLSLNKGIQMARTNIIARMDADDICLEDRLEKEYRLLMSDDELTLVSCNTEYIDEHDNVIYIPNKLPENYSDICLIMEHLNIIAHPSVMYKKDCVIKLGMYRNIPACEDYDLWLRFIDSGFRICITNDRLLKYRTTSNGISKSNLLKQYCTAEYVKLLHKERCKTGSDKFTYDGLYSYLTLNNCFSEHEIDRFNKGFAAKENINICRKNGDYTAMFRYFFIAFFSGDMSRKVLLNNIRSNIIKRKVINQ